MQNIQNDMKIRLKQGENGRKKTTQKARQEAEKDMIVGHCVFNAELKTGEFSGIAKSC